MKKQTRYIILAFDWIRCWSLQSRKPAQINAKDVREEHGLESAIGSTQRTPTILTSSLSLTPKSCEPT